MAIAAMAMGDNKDKEKDVDAIGEECMVISDPDRCEQAIKLGKCMEEGAKKRNLKPE